MIKRISLLAACALFASSCSKKDEPSKANAKTVVIDATSYTDYVYFSFEQGKVVKTAKYDDEAIKKDQSWDLGLHRYEFRTNSGTSGSGKGGAYETSETNINASIPVPASVETDKMQRQLVASPHAGGGNPSKSLFDSYVDTPANLVLTTTRELKEVPGSPMPAFKIIRRGAIVQDLSVHLGGSNTGGPSTVVSDKVYIVRTTTGKHAKVKVLSHKGILNGKADVTAVITLQYVYPID